MNIVRFTISERRLKQQYDFNISGRLKQHD
jgi:hypothetical protein